MRRWGLTTTQGDIMECTGCGITTARPTDLVGWFTFTKGAAKGLLCSYCARNTKLPKWMLKRV